jgi:hypothetical protein
LIIDYPDDKPLPSKLLLGFSEGRPIHVVFAYDATNETGYIVTAYIPDKNFWSNDFKTRSKTRCVLFVKTAAPISAALP